MPTCTNSSYINLAHCKLGSSKRMICLRISTSKGTCVCEKTQLSCYQPPCDKLVDKTSQDRPTSGTNTADLGPVAFWMAVRMSSSVKSSHGSTSCTCTCYCSSLFFNENQVFIWEKWKDRHTKKNIHGHTENSPTKRVHWTAGGDPIPKETYLTTNYKKHVKQKPTKRY